MSNVTCKKNFTGVAEKRCTDSICIPSDKECPLTLFKIRDDNDPVPEDVTKIPLSTIGNKSYSLWKRTESKIKA